jgi:hypothetical protein
VASCRRSSSANCVGSTDHFEVASFVRIFISFLLLRASVCVCSCHPMEMKAPSSPLRNWYCH